MTNNIKLFSIALLICLTMCLSLAVLAIQAAELQWDSYAEQDKIKGFVIYSQEVTPEMDGQLYSAIVNDPSATNYQLDPTLFEPGHTYRFWITAFNDLAESEKAQADKDWTPAAFLPSNVPRPVTITVQGPVSNVTIIQQ